jgi:7-carboxy-7-deazaguanine synthase
MKLRYSEAFYSLQGEGKFVGVPSVFLRTFGCNFRCKAFSMSSEERESVKDERYNPEVKKLIESGVHIKATQLEDLPIIHTGCDTYASIYPEFKHLMFDRTVDEVVDHLLSLTPNGKWTMDNGQDIHLVVTGGEPLLAWQKMYVEIFEHPRMSDLRNVTFETNTTQSLHDELFEYLDNTDTITVTWSCSPKLSVSGEVHDDAIKPGVAVQYSLVTGNNLYLKFVVSNAADVAEVDAVVAEYRNFGVECPVYLMPIGGRSEEYDLSVQDIAQLALDKGYRFSPRLHISLYGNEWGT